MEKNEYREHVITGEGYCPCNNPVELESIKVTGSLDMFHHVKNVCEEYKLEIETEYKEDKIIKLFVNDMEVASDIVLTEKEIINLLGELGY